MSQKKIAFLLFVLGLMVLLSMWGNIADWTEAVVRREQVRPKRVVYWTSSGSPEVDLKRARQFEQMYPKVNVEPNFRETGGLNDILFVSFLSGNPPDYMNVKVNELRKYVLMGGVRPLDDLLEAENTELRRRALEERVGEYVAKAREAGRDLSEKEIAAHRQVIRNKLAAYEREQNAKGNQYPFYFRQYLIGQAKVYRFSVNPDDRFLREMEKYPKQAARLLAMNGRVIGMRGVSMPRTITYNKRIFREAARMFPDAGLVDADGEPIPPETWLEFYRTAKVLTEYGRRAAEERGLDEPICYGVVIQGQRQRDIVRGIKPLAARAGCNYFDYTGDTEHVSKHFEDPALKQKYAEVPIGYFDYDNPAVIASFALLVKLKHDDFVLPGTESRHYEDVRTALASGRAGMVIDGWHAALIGAERVPWAAQDLGSAPVPVPYHAVDPDAGWTAQKVSEEKKAIHQLLALDKLDIELPEGNKLPRTTDEGVEFYTSLVRNPEAVWEWRHFDTRNPEIMKAETRRGTVRMEVEAIKHLDDPEWFPYPYQQQIYDIIENHCALWPEKPLHGPVQPATEQEVFYKWFYQTDTRDLGKILAAARREVAKFTEAANADLAQRIADGEVRREEWTFPDWDPSRAQTFFDRQQNASQSEEMKARLAAARKKLIKIAREKRPEVLNEERTDLAANLWHYDASGNKWLVLLIPGLMGTVVLVWLLWNALRDRRDRRPMLRDLARGARSNWHGYIFVFPGMLALFTFAIYPSLYQFYLAAQSGDGLGAMRWVGWENFERILGFWNPDQWDDVFWTKVVPNTFGYMAVVMAGQISIGLLVASLLNLPLRANRYYRVLFFIPLVTSLAVISVILIGLLKGPDSGLNRFLDIVGFEVLNANGKPMDWLGQEMGLFTVMAVGIWHGLPYTIILLLAGLQSISPDLYEAAKVDGAGAWRRFVHVTIPGILPILIIIAFNVFIGAARAFSVVFVLTEGGVDHSSELVATYIFKKGFMKPEGQEADLGYGSALGIVYSLMLMGVTFVNVRIIAKRWRRRLDLERRAGKSEEELARG